MTWFSVFGNQKKKGLHCTGWAAASGSVQASAGPLRISQREVEAHLQGRLPRARQPGRKILLHVSSGRSLRYIKYNSVQGSYELQNLLCEEPWDDFRSIERSVCRVTLHMAELPADLKVHGHEIFNFSFFHDMASPLALMVCLKPIRIFMNIIGDIHL